MVAALVATAAVGQAPPAGATVVIDIVDEEIGKVIRDIARLTGVQVIVDERVTGRVTVHVPDLSGEEAVELVARQGGYRVEREGAILRVVPPLRPGEFRVVVEGVGEEARASVEAAEADLRAVLIEIAARTGLSVAPAPEVTGKASGVLRGRPAAEALEEVARWAGYVVARDGATWRVGAPAPLPAPRLVLDVRDGRIRALDAPDPGVPLDEFTRRVLAVTGLNLVPAADATGMVKGRLGDVPVEEGIRAILEQNGFAVRRTGSIWRVSSSPVAPAGATGAPAAAGAPAAGIEVSADDSGLLSIRATDAELKALLSEIATALDTRLTVPTSMTGKVPIMIEDGISIEDALYRLLASTPYGFAYRRGGWIVADRAAQPNQPNVVYDVAVLPFENRVAKEVRDVLSQRFPAASIRFLDDRNAVVIEGPPDILEEARRYARALDVAPGTVVVEAYLVEIRDQQTFTERFSIQVTGGATSILNYTPGGQNADLALTIDPAGTFDRSIWQATIRWLEERGAAVVSGHSVVATVPGREAELRVATVERVQVSLPTASVNNPSVDFKEVPTGLTMTMTPYVGDGSDRIIVDLALRDASEVGRSPQSNFPITSERQSKTRLTWESGRVTFMGSLKRRSQQNTRGQVPLLGDIPVIGRLFRSQTIDDRTTTLALFLAPRVVRGDEAAAARAEIPRSAEIVIGDDRIPVALPASEVPPAQAGTSHERAVRGFRGRRPVP